MALQLGSSLASLIQPTGRLSALVELVPTVLCTLSPRQLAQILTEDPSLTGLLLVDPDHHASSAPVGILRRADLGSWRWPEQRWQEYADRPLSEIVDWWDPCQKILLLEESVSLQQAAQRWVESGQGGIAVPSGQGWGLVDPLQLMAAVWQEQPQCQKQNRDLAHLRRQNEMILNSAGEGIYGLDLAGKVTFANPAAARMIGWSPEELVGQSMHDLLHHSHADHSPYPRVCCPIYLAFQDGQIRSVSDEVFWRKDGSCFPVEYTSTPMRNQQGQLVGAVVTFQDISQRKWAEAIFKQNQEELERKVRERTAELRQANQQLRELSDLKSRFVSMVCHEFRTPLNTILFAVTSLERYRHQLSDQAQHDYTQGIQSDIQHMTQMLDDVLLLGKTDARKLEPQPVELEIVQFCQTLTQEMQLTQEQPIIHFETSHLSQRVYLDPVMLRSILINLLSNAMKYSQPHQTVDLRLKAYSDHIMLEVSDQGIGIPEQDRPYLFDPFHRGRNVGTIPGTGLGLTIIKRLIDLLAGSVEVNSQLGSGTTFRVRLPLASDLP